MKVSHFRHWSIRKILVVKPRMELVKPQRKYEDNIKIDLREIVYEDVD